MENKKILVANHHLDKFGGSETFTFTFIDFLLKKGYSVEYFTFQKGIVSDKIENDLQVSFMREKHYDYIFANHNTCVRYLSSRGMVIQTCHGIYPRLEQPSKYADGHIAISIEVLEYIKSKGFQGEVLLNGIDCTRFSSKEPINNSLKSVLSLCQSESANEMILSACKKMNINFKSLNKYANPIWNVENVINEVDLVIGLGRSAYEAMACGRAVLIFDNRAYFKSYSDGYVNSKMLNESIINNCSGRRFKNEYDVDDLVSDFKLYDKVDGSFLRDFALKNLNMELQVQEYLNFAIKTRRNFRIDRALISKYQFAMMSFKNFKKRLRDKRKNKI